MEGHDSQRPDGQNRQPPPLNSVHQGGVRSSPGLPHQRRFDESWVEVSSQPSSSSLSSIGDEIVTTGLRVGDPYRRRRRLRTSARSLPQHSTVVCGTRGSSQEDGDESETDSDEERDLTSSAENVPPSLDAADDSEADSGDGDDADDATALGRISDRPVFHPQPNAFTHHASHGVQRRNSTNSTLPAHPHSGFTRPSFAHRSQTRVHRGGPNFMSPNAREESDAALRASLTTLLSCAAAARGLPKSKEEAESRRAANNGVGPSNQPMEMRLVPESELMAESDQHPMAPSNDTRKQNSAQRSPSRATSSDGRAKQSVHVSKSPRAAKKKKTTALAADETAISPTLLTWVVSAGVVVLVSVVGFGAGYVIGREVGRQEALSAGVSSVNDTTECGREVMRSSGNGLRRFRWGAVGKSLVAQA